MTEDIINSFKMCNLLWRGHHIQYNNHPQSKYKASSTLTEWKSFRGKTTAISFPPSPMNITRRLFFYTQVTGNIYYVALLHFIIMEPPSSLLGRSTIPTVLDIPIVICRALLHNDNVQGILVRCIDW